MTAAIRVVTVACMRVGGGIWIMTPMSNLFRMCHVTLMAGFITMAYVVGVISMRALLRHSRMHMVWFNGHRLVCLRGILVIGVELAA